MKSFLNFIFLDNPVSLYLLVILTILLSVVLRRFISRYIAGILFNLIRRLARGVDKNTFVKLVRSPLEIFMVIVVTIIAVEKLNYPSALDFKVYKVSGQAIFSTLSIIILILSFVWLLLRIIDFIAMLLEQKSTLSNDLSDSQLIVFFKDFFKVVLVIVGLLLILKFGFSFQISSLITGLSIAGAAIALSTRESIENLIASFIIFFDKPFTMGDTVKVHHIIGTVEKIGLRSTRLRTDQKTFVTVPNKQMVDSIMDNLSLRTQRRVFVQLDLSTITPPDTITQLILGIEGLLQRRKDKIENYTVFLSDITRNSFTVHIEFFTPTIPMTDFNTMRQEINISIIQMLDDLNIQLVAKEAEGMNAGIVRP